ncbi:MAG: PQQ-dependent dehydrogenase, methanol/ethanol family [Vicinamibacterales bacterium]
MNARACVGLMLATFAVSWCGTTETRPTFPENRRIIDADREPGSWLTHGRTYSEQRFSPLTSVTPESVSRLGLAWSYELRTTRGAEATPLVVDGVMYVTSSWSIVYALDAKTGKELWVYDPEVNRAVAPRACCDVVNRGVAFYGGRVYVGTIDGRLVALDATSGAKLWERLTIDGDHYTITGAPRAANGMVFIGNGGAEYGVRGYLSAQDAATGENRWRFYTVPGDPSKLPEGAASDSVMPTAVATWTGEWWKLGGGGTVYDAIVFDDEFNQLLIGVGNGSPWNQQIRSPRGGDNLFLASIVAIDASSGIYKWHYQTAPGETWDYNATQPIVLADLTIDGVVRKVAMQAPKNGFFYVIDRRNGSLISAKPFVPMYPTAETPKGMPLSWAYAIDQTTGRPIENPEARYLKASVVVRPGPQGAHNWHPMAFSPRTGLVYLPTQELPFEFAHDSEYKVRPGFWNTGVARRPLSDDPAVRAAIRKGATGALVAWDPVAQKEAWRSPRRGPWNGGTLATAGGVVFQGTVDGQFLAMDAATGKELWSYDNQAATLAGPISYEVDGEQYVAVLAGNGSVFNLTASFLAPAEQASVKGRVYVFKIGGSAPKPTIERVQAASAPPPVIPITAEQYTRGAQLYTQYCVICHGAGVISGGAVPDLRRSPRLQDAAIWSRIVHKGELKGRGMPGFEDQLTAPDAELIRAYVARQAARP